MLFILGSGEVGESLLLSREPSKNFLEPLLYCIFYVGVVNVAALYPLPPAVRNTFAF